MTNKTSLKDLIAPLSLLNRPYSRISLSHYSTLLTLSSTSQTPLQPQSSNLFSIFTLHFLLLVPPSSNPTTISNHQTLTPPLKQSSSSSSPETPAFLLGALTSVGGIIGYARTGSIPSIAAGLTVGSLVRNSLPLSQIPISQTLPPPIQIPSL
ncbi:MAG: hypothetical protein Q9160_006525 [Pyrenula sp. 1 TL-2023]